MNAPTRQQGFSLIEILIVLAILGILLGIGGFNLNRYIQTSRLNEATKIVGETLRRVSELAVTKSQKMIATINTNSISWEDEATHTPRGSQTLPYAASITNKTTSSVTFLGRGIPEQDENFEISLGSKTKTVYLFVTGAVSYP
jgi:prepilin-type N-terminal cleavage/methylation domain-containing protein